jgi:molybdopterin-guanine dinucleotide biosynthesis protein A
VTTAAIVLAGGASSRFGGDKLAAEYQGRPVLHHALAAVAAVADPVVLVLGPDTAVPAIPPGLAASLRIARDAVAHQGPLAGLAGGLAALPAGIDRAIVVAGDMPALVPEVLRALLDAVGADIAIAAACLEADPPSPLPMAMRRVPTETAAIALLDADRRSLRALLDAVPSVVVPAATWRRLDPDGATLRDIDTPGDLSEC